MIDVLQTTTLALYPELRDDLTPEQWQSLADGYRSPSKPEEAAEWDKENDQWIHDRIVTRAFGDRALRVFVDVPAEQDDNKLFIALGEFGNGITEPAVHRARVVRDVVSPESTLILLPNDTYDERDNLALTRRELDKLRDQDATPLVERLQSLSEGFEDVAVFGPSQGATLGAIFGAHKNSPVVSLGAIEAPNVVRRPNRLSLAKDFAKSAGHLAENIQANAPQADSAVVERHVGSINALGTLRYGLGLLLPSNLAIAALMKNNNFKFDARRTIERGGSVAHVWTAGSPVSPDVENMRIAEELGSQTRYSSLRLAGETADHSSTNIAAVCVAAMNRAIHARQS